jgi:hypothetical protein
MTSHLIFIAQETLLTEQPSYGDGDSFVQICYRGIFFPSWVGLGVQPSNSLRAR